jgi:hypothetical protein
MSVVQEVRAAWGRRPFRPFTLKLRDGRKLDVESSEQMCFSHSFRTICLQDADGAFAFVPMSDIQRVEVSGATEMTMEQLQRAHHSQPFVPFLLHMADGRDIAVDHPECMAYHPESGRTAVITLPNDGWEVVDVLMVTSMEFRAANGSRKRRK